MSTTPASSQTLRARLSDGSLPSPGERILDVGCGDGALTQKLAELGSDVVGIDTSELLLAAAKARGLDARKVDVRQMPFDGEFDAVFSNAVLHWVREPAEAARSMRKALKPGGGLRPNSAATATSPPS